MLSCVICFINSSLTIFFLSYKSNHSEYFCFFYKYFQKMAAYAKKKRGEKQMFGLKFFLFLCISKWSVGIYMVHIL